MLWKRPRKHWVIIPLESESNWQIETIHQSPIESIESFLLVGCQRKGWTTEQLHCRGTFQRKFSNWELLSPGQRHGDADVDVPLAIVASVVHSYSKNEILHEKLWHLQSAHESSTREGFETPCKMICQGWVKVALWDQDVKVIGWRLWPKLQCQDLKSAFSLRVKEENYGSGVKIWTWDGCRNHLYNVTPNK